MMTTIMGYSLEEFAELVNQDLKNLLTEEKAAWLRSEEILPFWRDQLGAIAAKVDARLSRHKADRQQKRIELNDKEWEVYLAGAEDWKANTLWFKKTIGDRLMECKLLQRQLINEHDDTEIIRLRSAIESHRCAVESDVEPEEADQKLWATL